MPSRINRSQRKMKRRSRSRRSRRQNKKQFGGRIIFSETLELTRTENDKGEIYFTVKCGETDIDYNPKSKELDQELLNRIYKLIKEKMEGNDEHSIDHYITVQEHGESEEKYYLSKDNNEVVKADTGWPDYKLLRLPLNLDNNDVTVVVKEELMIAADGGGRYKKKTRKSKRSRKSKKKTKRRRY